MHMRGPEGKNPSLLAGRLGVIVGLDSPSDSHAATTAENRTTGGYKVHE